jgi:CHAT domain-containing protein
MGPPTIIIKPSRCPATFDALKKNPAMGRAEALRRAMLAMIEDHSSPWNAYPDYWGPFSIVGEGGAS